MQIKPKILGIIPARGGSRGLAKKNTKILLGKPLIYYTINEAKKSKYLTRLVISTEDKSITKIAKKYDVELVPRPKKLARDNTPSLLVFHHVIQYLSKNENYSPDVIVILQPTSPLRISQDIDKSIKLFLNKKSQTVLSANKVEHPHFWLFNIRHKKLKQIFKENKIKRRQDVPDTYTINGAVYVFNKRDLLNQNFSYGHNDYAYIMPKNRSIDIDSEFEFKLAEFFLKQR